MKTIDINKNDCAGAAKNPVIILNTSQGPVIIPVQQILRIQAISNYSKLFFTNGKSLVVAKVLHWFEEQSSLVSLMRIHRSHLVNMQYIASYSGNKSGLLSLQNSEVFTVSKRKKRLL